MIMDNFSYKALEELKNYVYCLVDPTDNKIFYIGKGQNNRVFDHAKAALNETDNSLKLEKIRSIICNGLDVKYYIIRHNLDVETAFILESTLIDLVSYKDFNTELLLTNIQSGHHQWNEGIKTVDEIEQMYASEELMLKDCEERLFIVKLNQTVYNKKENKDKDNDKIYQRPSMYESTRKWWLASKQKMSQADFFLGVYKGIVRAVYKPMKDSSNVNILESEIIKGHERYGFVCDDPENCAEYQHIVDKYMSKRLMIQDNKVRKGYMDCQKEFRYWKIK